MKKVLVFKQLALILTLILMVTGFSLPAGAAGEEETIPTDAWQSNTGVGEFATELVHVGNLLIAGSTSSPASITAFDTKTGNISWWTRDVFPYPGKGKLAGDAEYLYAIWGKNLQSPTYEPGAFKVFETATGNPLWGFSSSQVVDFAAGGTNVYLYTTDGTVYALNKVDGAVVWQKNSGSTPLADPAKVTMAAGSSEVLVSVVNGPESVLIAFDAVTGEEKWKKFVPVVTELVVSGSRAFAVQDKTLTVYNTATGNLIWKADFTSTLAGEPKVTLEEVWVTTKSGEVAAFSPVDGTQKVSYQLGVKTPYPVAVKSDRIYAATDDGTLVAFDRTTKAVLWRLEYKNFSSSPIIAGDVIAAKYVPGGSITGGDKVIGVTPSSELKFLYRTPYDPNFNLKTYGEYTFHFNRPIDPATVTIDNIKVNEYRNGNAYPVEISLKHEGNRITIIPTMPFTEGMRIETNVKGGPTGVKSAAGRTMANNISGTADVKVLPPPPPDNTPPSIVSSSVVPRTVAYQGSQVPGYTTVTLKANEPVRGSIRLSGNGNSATIVLSMSDYKNEFVVNWAPWDHMTKKPLPPGDYTMTAELSDQGSNMSYIGLGTLKVVAEPNPRPLISNVAVTPQIISPKYAENKTLTTITYELSRHAQVQVVLRKDNIEYFVGPKQKLAPGKHSLEWNGRKTVDGVIVPDGDYEILFKTIELNYNYPEITPTVTSLGKVTVKDGEHLIPEWRMKQIVTGASSSETLITPDGDGVNDTVSGTFTLAESGKISVWITNAVGAHIKALMQDVDLGPGIHSFTWDGRDYWGGTVPNGKYLLKVTVSETNGFYGGLIMQGIEFTLKGSLQIKVPEPVQQVRVVTDTTPIQVDPMGQGYTGRKGEVYSIIKYVAQSDYPYYEVLITEGVVGRVRASDVELVNGNPNPNPNPNPTVHTVAAGDTLWKIAQQYKTTIDAIVKANNLDPNGYLMVGQKLVISSGQAPGTPAPNPGNPGQTPGGTDIVHTVAADDTLWKIAQAYKTTVDAIVKANNLDPNGYLIIGQKLVIPSGQTSGTPAPNPGTPAPSPGIPGQTPGGTGTVHTVAAGDTLWKIAQMYKTTVDAIVKANSLDPNTYLTVGQKLVIPDGSVPPAPQPVVHTVQAGDTLWKISQQYGTTVDALVKLNQLDPTKPIYVGQKIKVSN